MAWLVICQGEEKIKDWFKSFYFILYCPVLGVDTIKFLNFQTPENIALIYLKY